MAQQIIDIGDAPNDGTGEPLRAGGVKINANFTELYTSVSGFSIAVAQLASEKLDKSGGTMTGGINLGGFGIAGLGAPDSDDDATNRGYVDGKDALVMSAVLSNAASLDGSPWLNYDGLTLSGFGASTAWTPNIRSVALAIKSLFLDGAVDPAETYYIGTFCYEDATSGDSIIVRKVSDNSALALSGAAIITKSTTGLTEVTFTGANVQVRMLVDYRELTKGVLVNSAVPTPLLIGRDATALDKDRINRPGQVRGSLWLDPDAPALVGVAASYRWDTNSRVLGRAIKDLAIFNADPAKRYRIFQVANGHATEGDRIRIVDEDTQTSVLDTQQSAVVVKNASGVTRVELTGSAISAVLYIDYRELTAGTNYAVSSGPLIIAKQTLTDVLARRSMLPRVRNIALDPTGGLGTGVYQGTNVPAMQAASAALVARGVVRSHAFGTGSTATAIYKRDTVQGTANGQYAFVATYALSADGTDWPTNLKVYAYSAATGGSLVSGTRTIESGYDQISTNLRRYWSRVRLPSTGTIGSVVYGFEGGPVANTAVEIGGRTLAISDTELIVENIAVDDWGGYSTRDSWRDNVDTNLAGAAAIADAAPKLRPADRPWFNLYPNPNLDPLEVGPIWNGSTPTLVTPASAEFSRRGILRAVNVGTGGAARIRKETILDANSSGQYYFASLYAYSADGVTWPAPGVYWYTASAYVGGGPMPSFIQVDANNRWYYRSGQLPVRADLAQIWMGTTAAVSGTVAQIGGFTFDMYPAALSIDDVIRDEWYPQATRRDSQIDTRRKAVAGGGLPFAGETWVMTGDSITDSYGVPDAVAGLTGATVINGGFGGCRLTARVTASQPETYQANFSMCRLAQAIASGDWSAQIQAAADNYAYDNTYDKRAKVATLAATNWSTVKRLLIDWGTNDYSAGRALGATSSANEVEFNGAINLTVQRLLTAFPTMQLIFVTPWYRGPNATLGDSNVNPNGQGVFLSAFQDALIERGRYYQIPAIRMHELFGSNVYNVGTYQGDHLHPTQPVGRDRKAKILFNQMRLLAS